MESSNKELILALTNIALAITNKSPSLYYDSYFATGQGAAGEFSTPTRKTFDVSSIPTGKVFFVYAKNSAGDGSGLRNVTVNIAYNSLGYGQDSMTQYHQSVNTTVELLKVAGQDSVVVQMGGSAASQTHQTHLQQIS